MLGPARLKPWEVERLTLADVADLLDEDFDSRQPPQGYSQYAPPMTHEERIRRLEEYRQMTPAQKLAHFKAQRMPR